MSVTSAQFQKILVYTPKFYPSVGGLENITLMLVKEFVRLGHDVSVICFEHQKGCKSGVNTFYRPSIIKQVKLFLWCSVFYMPNISLKGFWLMIFGPHKRWIVSHNNWYRRNDNRKGWQDILKLASTHLYKNIAVSNSVASVIPAPCHVIHNCYDNVVFHDNYDIKRSKDFVFVGRLVSDKGCVLLIDAFYELSRKNIETNLTIIGDGPERKNLEKKVSDLGLTDKVEFTGILRGEDLARVLNRCSIMVIPSLWEEPFGIVALEGLACGCQLICSAGGGLSEAADKWAVYFSNGNVKELTGLMMDKLKSKCQESPQERRLRLNYLQKKIPSIIAESYIKVFID